MRVWLVSFLFLFLFFWETDTEPEGVHVCWLTHTSALAQTCQAGVRNCELQSKSLPHRWQKWHPLRATAAVLHRCSAVLHIRKNLATAARGTKLHTCNKCPMGSRLSEKPAPWIDYLDISVFLLLVFCCFLLNFSLYLPVFVLHLLLCLSVLSSFPENRKKHPRQVMLFFNNLMAEQ